MSERSPSDRCFPNDLIPLSGDRKSLENTLAEFRSVVQRSLELLADLAVDTSSSREGPYIGLSGLAFMYLRLRMQAKALNLPEETYQILSEQARVHLPADKAWRRHRAMPGRISPLDSYIGVASIEIQRQLIAPLNAEFVRADKARWDIALETLSEAIEVALADEEGTEVAGNAEILYGRAGLLSTLIGLSRLVKEGTGDSEKKRMLAEVVSQEVIRDLAGEIFEAGLNGVDVAKRMGIAEEVKGLELVWQWHGKVYLGAIHGIAGILTILLQCPATTLSDDQISLVIRTAHCLIALSDEHGGHLPSSVPFRQHPEGELVQICHGAPGILLLCAALLNHHGPLSQKHASALQRACNVTWNEGLLKKGLGICHGVTGNAWSLLLLGNSTGLEPSERNLCTSRALSMLLHATSLPPLADVHAACHSPYHIPDHPQSLFEGLAGAVCAWSEAATYLQYRLNTSCADTTLLPPCIKPLNTLTMLGIPGLGGCGSVGIL